MFDVSAITSYIDIIVSFITENTGVFIGILIVIFGIRSSIRKKRRAEAESRGEVPKKKSFLERMAEMEAALDNEGEADDAEGEAAPYPNRNGDVRRGNDSPWQNQQSKPKDSPWASSEPAPEGPGNNRVKPSIPPVESPGKQVASVSAYYGENSATQSKMPIPESIDIRIEAPPLAVIQLDDEEEQNCSFSIKGKLGREKLTDAIVMAEVLAKPKALRRTGRC
jgi:hypothetical protein